MSVCCECNAKVLENFFTCAGECNKLIHFGCAGIKKPVFDAISIIPNFSWRCGVCMDVYKILKEKNDHMSNSIDAISASLSLLNKTSAAINNNVESLLKPTPSQQSSSVKLKNKTTQTVTEFATPITPILTRSKRNENNNITTASTVQSLDNNTRIDSPKKIFIGSGDLNSNLRTVEPLRWIFVSRLCKDVTDDDLMMYIKNKFVVDKPVLYCFRRNDDRDYVSFKIGIPVSKFDQMLDSSAWPPGVLIKEFLNSRRKLMNNNFLVPRSALTE